MAYGRQVLEALKEATEHVDLAAGTLRGLGGLCRGHIVGYESNRLASVLGRFHCQLIQLSKDAESAVVSTLRVYSEQNGVEEVTIIGLPDPKDPGFVSFCEAIDCEGNELCLSDVERIEAEEILSEKYAATRERESGLQGVAL
jgi:hypothetical protein